MKKNKDFDCVQMMRTIRNELSKRYADNPALMIKELREAQVRFEAKLNHDKRMAVAEDKATYGDRK